MACLGASAQTKYKPKVSDPLSEERRYALFPELQSKGARCMASSSETHLYWFGIETGLVSYDGYNWEYYGKESGFDHPVDRLLIDKNNIVYAAHQKGLARYKNGNWEHILKMPSSYLLHVYSIRELSSGGIAVSTQIGTILHYNNDLFLLTTHKIWDVNKEVYSKLFKFAQIPDRFLKYGEYSSNTDVFEYEEGQLWIAINYRAMGEKGEILKVEESEIYDQKITHLGLLSKIHGLKLGSEQTLFRSSTNDIWVINHSNRVPALRLSKGKWTHIDYGNPSHTDHYTEHIVESPDGNIWISGLGKIYVFDKNGKWKIYDVNNTKIQETHLTMHVGNFRDLWIMGDKSNVYRIDLCLDQWIGFEGINFQCHMNDSTLLFLDFKGNLITKQGDLWLKHDKKEFGIEHAVSVYHTADNIIWISGSSKGVASASYYKDNQWVNMSFPHLSWGVDYRATFQSSKGDIWIGGCPDIYDDKEQFGGVLQIINPYTPDREIVHHFPYNDNGLVKGNVYGIAQDNSGFIWTGGSILQYFDGTQWHKHKDVNLYDFVNDVYNDQMGNLYVASRHHGLYIDNHEPWSNFTSDGDLNSNKIISIATDENGENIWLATDRGYSLFNGEIWINDIFPKIQTLSFEDGSIDYSNDALWVSTCPRSWKRRVYEKAKPGRDILSQYRTYRIRKDTIAPETYIDKYTQSVDRLGNTAIFWSGKYFFNSNTKDQLLYSYKIDDEPWSKFENVRDYTFLNLADGTHTFSVRSMNLAGIIDLTPASIQFTVAPPVWKEAWFLILIASFVIIIGYFQYQIYKKRIKLEKSNETLTQKSEELALALERLKHTQTKLIQNEKMATLGVLSAGVAHEINNPLNFIKGGILALTDLTKKLENMDENVSKLLSAINEGVKRANAIVKSLGNFSRQSEATDEICDIHKTLEDCLLILHGAMKDKIVVNRVYSDKIIEVKGNEGKLHQAFLNILANAQQAIPDDGTITVCTYINSKNCEIRIEDTGIGISKENLARIGEPFFTTKPAGNGTGLGMAITFSIIDDHHGTLSVDSEIGKGSTFIVNLPLA